jgi:tetratricopeptide (TPR) repeat protein
LISTIYYMGGGLEPKQFYPKAKAAALRALDIDDTESEAYVALANEALFYEWNWPDAERQYKRAIELNPSSASAHERYATYLQTIGRFEDALAERNLTLSLDPRSPFRIANTGYPLYYAGRYDEAIRRFRQALEADSRFYWANLWIGQALVEQRRYPEAIAEIERAVTLSERNTRVIATLGNTYGLAGRRVEAQAILNELRTRSRQTYVSAFYLALVYVGLGMRDETMEHLEKAVEERQPYLVGLNVEPPFLGLHDDPRFQAIVRRIGIPTAAQ